MDSIKIMCMPTDLEPNPVKGSRLDKCSLCDNEVWVAKSSDEFKEKNLVAVIVCLRCAVADMRPGDKIVPQTPSQKAEVFRELMAD
jgi:hypothetical protein